MDNDINEDQGTPPTSLSDDKVDLKRWLFWVRVGLAIAMGVAGGVVAVLFNENTRTTILAANGLAFFIIAILVLAYFAIIKNPDEFERRIEMRAFADASLLVIVWSVTATATDQLIDGGNAPNIFRAPGLLMLLQTLIAQGKRRYFALEKEETLKNKWLL